MYMLDSQWTRIDDEFDTDGNLTVPLHACMVRMHGGGMIVGRIVKVKDNKFSSQKYRFGKFIQVGESESISDALRKLEEFST